MSSDLFEDEDLDGNNEANSINSTAEELKTTPMSAPPRRPVTRPDQKPRKAKYIRRELPQEVQDHVKVYDRYGQEWPDIIEFDPETFEGVKLSKEGPVKIYLYNGYVVADGLGYPDDDELPEVVKNVQEDVKRGKLKGNRFAALSPEAETSLSNKSTVDLDRKSLNVETRGQDSLRCPKCMSVLRMNELVLKTGEVKHGIVCTNGNCGMRWNQ